MYSRVFVLLPDGTEIEYDPCCYIAVDGEIFPITDNEFEVR